jgi:hypothetical protein
VIPSLPIIVLSCLVAGYTFLSNYRPKLYKISRQAPFIQYLTIGLYSIVLFAFSVLIYIILKKYALSDKLVSEYPVVFNTLISIFGNLDIIFVVVIDFFLSFSPRILYNRVFFNDIARLKVLSKIAEESPTESIIYSAFMLGMPICFTMDNGKVYIGYMPELYIPNSERTEIKLLPMISGYQHKDTKVLRITTRYHRVYDKLMKNSNDIDLSVFYKVIPYKNVQSTNLFDLGMYSEFFVEKKIRKL